MGQELTESQKALVQKLRMVVGADPLPVFKGLGARGLMITEDRVQCRPVCHGDSDNDTGFTYYRQSGHWRCWTRGCHEKKPLTDIFSLIQIALDLPWREAFRWVAGQYELKTWGQLESYEPRALQEYRDQQEWLAGLDNHSMLREYEESWLRDQMLETKYVAQRLGLAQDSKILQGCWHGLMPRFEPMRDRVVFPIKDSFNRYIAMTGRHLFWESGMKEPKWKHLGPMGKVLFPWHLSRSHIASSGLAYVVEGPIDALRMLQLKHPNVVCLGGKMMSRQQALLLSQVANQVILVLDSDEAGQEGVEAIWKRFRGMFMFQSVQLPKGKDLDDLSLVEGRSALANVKTLF